MNRHRIWKRTPAGLWRNIQDKTITEAFQRVEIYKEHSCLSFHEVPLSSEKIFLQHVKMAPQP